MNPRFRIALAICSAVFIALSTDRARAAAADDAASPLPVAIKPDDPKLYYVGRFDTRDAKGPRAQWPASELIIRFRGTALQVKLSDTKDDCFNVCVDDQKPTVVEASKGEHLLDLAANLPDGEHVVKLVKRTESNCGIVQIENLYLNEGGALLEPRRMTRKIEIIGDSISCGYGNEAADKAEHFSAKTENASLAYGAIAAKAFDAEYACIAWSGRKMSPDFTLPSVYDFAVPGDPKTSWDFSKWTPDVVLINLATNDFGKAPPEEQKWTADYEAFVKRVRKNYPQATIYLASGSMMNDDWPKDAKSLTVLKSYLAKIESDLKTEGEAKLHVIHFAPQNAEKNGVGADWHPSVKTHEAMAKEFEGALEKDFGWKPATPKE